jgi:hypothetical protein
VREVHTLGDEPLGLAQKLGVEDGEEGRIVADVVLDQEDHLHAYRPRVVGDIPLVLDVLDDGEEDPRVSLPDEDALELAGLGAGQDIRQLVVVESQEHDRNVEPRLPHLAGQLQHVHVADVKGGDDQVEALLVP